MTSSSSLLCNRILVKSLQYPTFTRLDLSFAVNYASQFIHAASAWWNEFFVISNIHLFWTLYCCKIWFEFLCIFRQSLDVPLVVTPILYSNNLSALHLIVNPVFRSRSKHIELKFHYVHERVTWKLLHKKFVRSTDQVADIFKSLSQVIYFRNLLSSLIFCQSLAWGEDVKNNLKREMNASHWILISRPKSCECWMYVECLYLLLIRTLSNSPLYKYLMLK